jgi:hypothetical protein
MREYAAALVLACAHSCCRAVDSVVCGVQTEQNVADVLEHIRRAGVLSVVPENAEVIVRAQGVEQLAAILQHVATSKAFSMQV